MDQDENNSGPTNLNYQSWYQNITDDGLNPTSTPGVFVLYESTKVTLILIIFHTQSYISLQEDDFGVNIC